MTGNHYANNQKDPYVSTVTYLSNWPYIVCTVTTIPLSKKLDRELTQLLWHRDDTHGVRQRTSDRSQYAIG